MLSGAKPSKPTEPAGTKILLVEDNPINREIASAMLKKLGYVCELAEDGKAALAATALQKFDLVLMDCGLPEMDGFETTRLLRKQENGKHRAKVFALTASAFADVAERCREAGMDGVLTKPITRNDLQKVLGTTPSSEKTILLDSKSKFVEHPLSHIIERKVLEDLVAIESGGVADFVSETFQDYLSHIEKQISLIASSIATGDFIRAREGAHGARGSSANMGITRLQKLFGEMETLAQKQDREEIRKVLAMANEKVSELRAEFPKTG
jgi:CheY-like chemotaxis protein